MAAAEGEYLRSRRGTAAVSYRILVLEGITDRGLEVLKAEGWPVDVQKAMPPAELARDHRPLPRA